jgi:hemoglobin-like flavoprotein
MTAEEIKLIKKTWRLIRQVDPLLLGDLFYSKLFSDKPSLRNMFPKKMEEQYNKLIDMLNAVVSRLERLDEINTEIIEMGRRHISYGVRPAHYKIVGSALLWTLQKGLGNDWTPDVKNAWTQCYTTLADTMINASKFPEKVCEKDNLN